nr:hypothetical protein [Candidatus Sigynarchaeum springense]
MELQQRIINKYVTRDQILAAGSKLGILKDDCLYFEGEDEVNVVMDLCIYEDWEGNGNAIQRYHEDPGPASDIETKLLDGMINARSSLFEVEFIDGIQINLRNILHDRHVHEPALDSFLEINFSKSCKIGMLVYTRLIPFAEFGVTSGIIFPFTVSMKSTLLDAYYQRFSSGMTNPLDEYALFFKLYRDQGIAVVSRYV